MNLNLEMQPSLPSLSSSFGDAKMMLSESENAKCVSTEEDCFPQKARLIIKDRNVKNSAGAAKRSRRKKKWKKPEGKPNRPLSAYNFFFQQQRSDMLGDEMPTAFLESLKKRVHCKTHGKIGFAQMAREIGKKWKALDPEEKREYESLAKKEKERYVIELSKWKESQKKDVGALDIMATAAMASFPIEDSSKDPPKELERAKGAEKASSSKRQEKASSSMIYAQTGAFPVTEQHSTQAFPNHMEQFLLDDPARIFPTIHQNQAEMQQRIFLQPPSFEVDQFLKLEPSLRHRIALQMQQQYMFSNLFQN